MDDKKKSAPKGTDEALRELLKQIVDNPELADRITITIRPAKLTQKKPDK